MNRDSPTEPTREELFALIAAQAAEIAVLKARIAELERRLGLDSSNSSKPPSSDGPNKPARVSSLRQPSGKKSGGQKSHKGETLRQTATPDAVVDHHPQTCSGCGAPLTPGMAESHRIAGRDPSRIAFAAHQVFDLPEPQPLVVTEHRAHVCRCESCGETTRAAFPESLPSGLSRGASTRRCNMARASRLSSSICCTINSSRRTG